MARAPGRGPEGAPLRALLGPGMSDEDDEVEEVLSRARTPGADEPASAAKPEPDAEAEDAEAERVAAAAAAEKAAAEAAERALASIGRDLDDVEQELGDFEAALGGEGAVNPSLLREVRMQLPSLNGNVDQLQAKVDGVASASAEVKARRRQLTEQAAQLSGRVQGVQRLLSAKVAATADSKKAEGNKFFAARDYTTAAACYSEAIAIDKTNPAYFCNRAGCHLNRRDWAEAIADAAEALALDAHYTKAYRTQTQAQLQLKDYAAAVRTVQSVPMGMGDDAVVVKLRQDTQDAIKAAGNAHFKAKEYSEAIAVYSLGIRVDDSNHVLFSNRSACHQARQMWKEALEDGRKAVALEPSFAKGYMHTARAQLQLHAEQEAVATIEAGLGSVSSADAAPLQALLATAKAAAQKSATADAAAEAAVREQMARNTPRPQSAPGGTASPATPAPGTPREGGEAQGAGGAGGDRAAAAVQLKEQGNAIYRSGQYAQALAMYSKAIDMAPEVGAYYGNRAACWSMMQQYPRAVDDCQQALSRDPALAKVRLRMVTALTHLGKLARALEVLQEGVALGGDAAAGCVEKLKALQQVETDLQQGNLAMEKGEFSKARTAFQKVVDGGGVWAEPHFKLGTARFELGNYGEAVKAAKAALAVDQNLLPAYLLRANALHRLGMTEKGIGHLEAAMQLDPDNREIAVRLKGLRRLVAETKRVREGIRRAMAAKQFDDAIKLCDEGLTLDAEVRILQHL